MSELTGAPDGSANAIRVYYERYWTDARGLIDIAPASGPTIDRLTALVTSRSEVLDFGCGDGVTVGTWLAARSRRYVGFDVSTTAVAHARSLGLDARVIPPDGRLPFADASFDLVTCVEVLEHLFEPQVALAELRRLIRPGGAIFATVPNLAYWRRRADLFALGRWNPAGDSLSVQQPWRDPHIRFFTRAALARLLLSYGFEEVVVHGQGGGVPVAIPGLRRFSRPGRASRLYRMLERRLPGLLGGQPRSGRESAVSVGRTDRPRASGLHRSGNEWRTRAGRGGRSSFRSEDIQPRSVSRTESNLRPCSAGRSHMWRSCSAFARAH